MQWASQFEEVSWNLNEQLWYSPCFVFFVLLDRSISEAAREHHALTVRMDLTDKAPGESRGRGGSRAVHAFGEGMGKRRRGGGNCGDGAPAAVGEEGGRS